MRLDPIQHSKRPSQHGCACNRNTVISLRLRTQVSPAQAQPTPVKMQLTATGAKSPVRLTAAVAICPAAKGWPNKIRCILLEAMAASASQSYDGRNYALFNVTSGIRMTSSRIATLYAGHANALPANAQKGSVCYSSTSIESITVVQCFWGRQMALSPTFATHQPISFH